MAQNPAQAQIDDIKLSSTQTAGVSAEDVSGEITTHHFSKSFFCNFSNNMGYSGFSLGANDTAESPLDEGFHLVPYWIPWASLNITEWNTMCREANRIRCTEMSFTMEEIQTTRIETKTEAGTTVLTSTVAPEGKIHMYVDHDHWTDHLIRNTDDTEIFEHNNAYRSPVCVGSAASATLPRAKIVFTPNDTAAFRAVSTTIPAYQGPSLYWDQGVQHIPSTQKIEHKWSGTEHWRVCGIPFNRDSDYDESGIPGDKAGQVTNQPEQVRSNRPLNDGTLKQESTRVGWYRSNLATGLNSAQFDRPETVFVKVEPAQNVGIGDIKMNAKAWITYRSTWQAKKRHTRLYQMDLTKPASYTAAGLSANWWLQSQYPAISHFDRGTVWIDTMQRYTRRAGTNQQPPILYGPSGQLPPRSNEG